MYKFSTFIYLDKELKIQNFRFEINFEKYKQVEQIKNKTFFWIFVHCEMEKFAEICKI